MTATSIYCAALFVVSRWTVRPEGTRFLVDPEGTPFSVLSASAAPLRVIPDDQGRVIAQLAGVDIVVEDTTQLKAGFQLRCQRGVGQLAGRDRASVLLDAHAVAMIFVAGN